MNRVKEIRLKHGVTQTEIAEVAGVSQRAVSQWETGKTDPSAASVSKIAAKYGEDAESIVFEDIKKGPENSIELSAGEKKLIQAIREIAPDKREVALLTAEIAIRGQFWRDLMKKLDDAEDMAERIIGATK
jgi:transcriptional regulator with XRE-family HTH domain|nr:MAG TPA: helix-turn-helix domain protein [Caudoviricetes sp.]